MSESEWMTLNEALARVRSPRDTNNAKAHFLACGFQPLHLETFLKAHLLDRFPQHPVELQTGQYGDLPGNLERAAASSCLATIALIEWSDLDPRLGLRGAGGWSSRAADIVASVETKCSRIADLIGKVASRMVIAVAPPMLPLPPLGSTIGSQASTAELEIRHLLSGLLLQLSRISGVRILHPQHLESIPSRLDARMELMAGFPFTTAYASALADALSHILYPPAPKKGLITDLDDSLWAGIVGEIGPESVGWTQESHAQVHGLYQQMLGNLAAHGALVGVCSKNELSVVETALARKDFLFQTEVLFPVKASWGPKSKAVEEILRTWNIAADSVVFVDDNPMELDEVRQAHPGITALQFFPKDPAKVWALIETLRDLFGKPVVLEEDSIRSNSIRASEKMREEAKQTAPGDFLHGLEGTVTLDFRIDPADVRPLELINKTNQFNLNGTRLSEGEWKQILNTPGAIPLTVSYQDKFGPLGKIAVLVARQVADELSVSHWVMSCRAFSRQIEHHALHGLLKYSGAKTIKLAFQPTERNQPLQEFLHTLETSVQGSETLLDPASLEPCFQQLPHQESYLKP